LEKWQNKKLLAMEMDLWRWQEYQGEKKIPNCIIRVKIDAQNVIII
jgi:hypothetical protein